jgi:hypothetical protein
VLKLKKNYKYEAKILFTATIALIGIFVGHYQGYPSIQSSSKNVVHAEERWYVASNSATSEADKVSNLTRAFGRYNSPLATQAAFFVDLSNHYQIDYRLLPAIAFSESSLCKNYHPQTHNCFGWGPHYTFASFEEAEETVARGLTTLPYYAKWRADQSDIYKLGNAYNPVDGPNYWTKKVAGFMEEIEQ